MICVRVSLTAINSEMKIVDMFFIILTIVEVIVIILQVNALLEALESKNSAQRKGHFALYNCGLSICGHWVGPMICNETGGAVCESVVPHGERFHVKAAPKHRFLGTLLSTLMGQGLF
jgi:hypothetical protein